jgi:hypothetical protein
MIESRRNAFSLFKSWFWQLIFWNKKLFQLKIIVVLVFVELNVVK